MTSGVRLVKITPDNFEAAIALRVHLGLGFSPTGETSGNQTVGESDLRGTV